LYSRTKNDVCSPQFWNHYYITFSQLRGRSIQNAVQCSHQMVFHISQSNKLHRVVDQNFKEPSYSGHSVLKCLWSTNFIFLIGGTIFCSEHLHFFATLLPTRLSVCSSIQTKRHIFKYKYHFHFKWTAEIRVTAKT